MQFKYHFAGDSCPPVFRIFAGDDPPERRSLLRYANEEAEQFCKRAQEVACRMWRRSGCRAHVRIECVYVVPSPAEDPHFFDDERWMDIALFRAVLDRPHAPAEVRVACAKALNRIHGLVPPDAE